MKKFICILTAFVALGFCTQYSCAQEYQDVVYLKSGSIIKGTIIEQVPGVSIKIKTQDGSIFVYKMEEVEKIAKEEPKETFTPTKTKKRFNIMPYTGLYFADLSVDRTSGASVTESSLLLWHIGVSTDIDFNDYIRTCINLKFIRKGAEDIFDTKGAYCIIDYFEIENSYKFGSFISDIKPYGLIAFALGIKLGANAYYQSSSADLSDYVQSLDFGFYFGGGVEIPVSKSFSFVPEVKYWLGLQDINDGISNVNSIKTIGFQINTGAKFYF